MDKQIVNDGDLVKENDNLVFNPYNSENIDIPIHEIQTILTKYGVPDKVHNINLYKRAFIHRSYTRRPQLENKANGIILAECPKNCMRLRTKSNERLEFLGDGVLECITKYYLYRRFPKENEGFMTEKKIALVKNEHIGKLAYEMGLHKWYVISKHAEEKKIRTNLKKLGCLFEAFLGALFLDFNKINIHDEEKWFENVFVTGPGFQIAQLFVERIFEKHVNWVELIRNDDNYKNILQVKIQKQFKVTPTYLLVNEDDDGYETGVYISINTPVEQIIPENAKMIHRSSGLLHISDLLQYYNSHNSLFVFLTSSKHKIKKKAEQQACEKALEILVFD